ncbi:hypothetical protein T07_7156, partial [Trichinella nelsoni]
LIFAGKQLEDEGVNPPFGAPSSRWYADLCEDPYREDHHPRG